MEWDNFRRSDNIEDRRGDDSGFDGGGGGGGGMIGGGGLGLGTIVVLGLIGWALGINPLVLIQGAQQVSNARNGYQTQQSEPAPRPQQQAQTGTPKDQMGQFVAAVLGETEDTWSRILPEQKGIQYQPVKLLLLRTRFSTSPPNGVSTPAMPSVPSPTNTELVIVTLSPST